MHNLLTATVLLVALSPTLSFATEQSELEQAIRQLDSAKQALVRAESQARSHLKTRVYFDYRKARQDIQTISLGINQYINSERAQPRDPRQLRTLSGEYDKVRN